MRQKRNYIGGLNNEHGVWLEGREQVRNYLRRRYEVLFKSSGADFPCDLEGLISPILDESDNVELIRVSCENEVKEAWRMDALKASGVDGLQ